MKPSSRRPSHRQRLGPLGEPESRVKKLQTFLVCLKTGGADRNLSLGAQEADISVVDR